MHCAKLLGQRLMAGDFDRQVAEVQVRIAVMNGYNALGILITETGGEFFRGKRNLGQQTMCATEPLPSKNSTYPNPLTVLDRSSRYLLERSNFPLR